MERNEIKNLLAAHFSSNQSDWLENFDKYFRIDSNGYVHGIAENAESFQLIAKNNLQNGIPVKFGTFRGTFHISYSGITNLNGCPSVIHGHFYCIGNQLKSLDGGPKIVTDRCYMTSTNLNTCVGLPQECQSYYLSNNNIESLEGIHSQKQSLLISVASNQIKDLNGCPESTTILDVSENPIVSLQGISEKIVHLTISMPCPVLLLLDTQIQDFTSLNHDEHSLEFSPTPTGSYKNDEDIIRKLLQKYRHQPLGMVDLGVELTRLKLNKYAKM